VGAQWSLGRAYEFGQGVEQDHAQAVHWYRKAADQGYAIAQIRLGLAYENGQGVIENYTQSFYWYRKAAMQGKSGAQGRLAFAYALGKGVPVDYEQAYAWALVAKATGEHLDETLEDLREMLTPAQIMRAQQTATRLHDQIQANIKAKANQP